MLLVFGMPLYLFIGGLGLIWFARRLVQAPPGVWGFYTKGGVLGIFAITAFLFFYIGFWLGQVWKVRRK